VQNGDDKQYAKQSSSMEKDIENFLPENVFGIVDWGQWSLVKCFTMGFAILQCFCAPYRRAGIAFEYFIICFRACLQCCSCK